MERMRRWQCLGLLIAVAILGCGEVVAAAPAAFAAAAKTAAQERVNSTQGGSCNAFSGAYQLPGSNGVVPAAYSDAGLVVPACGPIPGKGGGPNVYPYPGSLATPGYQCVEFAERYLYYKFGATMGISTNGDQVVAHYAAKYPSEFTVVPNGTANEAPVQGDVLSFSTVSTFNSTSGGHTAVVQSSSVNSAGNGSIVIVEENAVSSGVQVLTVSNWTVVYSGFPYIEWLHAPAAPPPSLIVIRSGSALLAKNGVTGSWVTEAGGLTSATKILAFGDMIGYIQANASGVPTLWAKQGLTGTWYDEYAPVNAAIFTG